MAEKILHTRIVNKHDTLENWISSDLILKEGEIALAKVETATQDAKGNIIYVPTFLMKVGDGTSTFAALNWLSAPASDVYSWAKAATKPTYSASEITGLSDYISGEIQDTDTQYKLVKVSDYNYKLQSKTLNGSWTDVDGSSIVIPDDTASITALQNLVGDTKVSTQIDNAIAALKLADNYDSKGSAAQALTDAKAYTDNLANGAVKTNTDAIAAIKDGSTIDSFADVETALDGKQAAGDYATRTEAQGYATNAKNAVIGNDSDNADSNTVKGAKKYADSLNTAMDTRMDAAEASITTLTGADTVEGSVAKALKDAKDYADTKVGSVAKGNDGIVIGGTATAPTVGVQIDDTAGNSIQIVEGKGIRVEIPAAAEYSVVKDENSGDYASVYHLTKDGVNTGAAINIPKDMVVQSGSVVTDPEGQPAGTYIKLVLQNVADPLYIDVGSLIEYVTSGSQTGDMVVVAVSDDHKVTATITDGTVTKAKLAAGVQTSLGLADNSVQKETGKRLMTDEEGTKLEGIAAGAQVNVIETVKVNGTPLVPDGSRAVDVTVPTGALASKDKVAESDFEDALVTKINSLEEKAHEHSNKTVLDGITAEKVTAWDKVSEKANDADLATIAKTGNVNDLIQTAGDVLVFDCGSSSVNV